MMITGGRTIRHGIGKADHEACIEAKPDVKAGKFGSYRTCQENGACLFAQKAR